MTTRQRSSLSIVFILGLLAMFIVAQIEPRFMARAVINLLRNAIRYAERRVEVSLVKFGSGYEVRVCDDGPGVPEEGRSKIFQPFMRLDASRDRRTGGFGLGLAIAREIAREHRGKLWAESDPKTGNTFLFSLPRAK